jgi:hypothetical protein
MIAYDLSVCNLMEGYDGDFNIYPFLRNEKAE